MGVGGETYYRIVIEGNYVWFGTWGAAADGDRVGTYSDGGGRHAVDLTLCWPEFIGFHADDGCKEN